MYLISRLVIVSLMISLYELSLIPSIDRSGNQSELVKYDRSVIGRFIFIRLAIDKIQKIFPKIKAGQSVHSLGRLA